MKSPGLWVVTILIIVLGVFLFFVVNQSDRDRREAMGEVEIGQPAAEVSRILGIEPTRCPAGPLDHLGESFPEGWPPPAVDVALEQLHAETAERWVYPIDDGVAQCAGATPRTEVGVGADGSVVWSVAVLGRSVLQLPPNVTPAGVDSVGAGDGSQ